MRELIFSDPSLGMLYFFLSEIFFVASWTSLSADSVTFVAKSRAFAPTSCLVSGRPVLGLMRDPLGRLAVGVYLPVFLAFAAAVSESPDFF